MTVQASKPWVLDLRWLYVGLQEFLGQCTSCTTPYRLHQMSLCTEERQ